MSTKKSYSVWNRLHRSEIALPLLVGCIARAAMFPFAHLKNPRLLEYGEIARLLLQGKGYAYPWSQYIGHEFILPSAYMPPGQVMIQYLGLLLFGDGLAGHAFIFLEEIIIGTAFIYAMWRILPILFSDRRVVRLGVWLSALYPSFIFAVSSFGVITAVLTLQALLLWALLECSSRLRKNKAAQWSAAAIGLLAGLLTLFRSESYPLIFLATAVALWPYRASPRITRSVVFICVGFLLAVAPWVLRNVITLHRFIPTSTTAGFNFWRGHNPEATGSSWDANGEAIWSTTDVAKLFEPPNAPDSAIEFKQNSYHFHWAMDWIAAHPAMELVLAIKKAILLWGIDWYSKEERSPAYVLLYSITFISLIAGVSRIRREKLRNVPPLRDATSLIGLWCVFYTGIAIAFFSLPRLQIMLIGFCFPVIIYGADSLLQKIAAQFRSDRNVSTLKK